MADPMIGNQEDCRDVRRRGVTPAGFEGMKAPIVELRRGGASFAAIARSMGISVYLVKRALAEAGCPPSLGLPVAAYRLDIPKERVEPLLRDGKSRYQIAKILGISGRSLLTLLARYNLKPAPSINLNRMLAEGGKRRCCECREVKNLATEFYTQSSAGGRKGYRCKNCSKNWLRRSAQKRRHFSTRDVETANNEAGRTQETL
ncbi:MAG: hypothetical protein QOF48_3969 [Verrucomicrobiota bacterium]|jgi:DNA-binding CsgD family transcriptional regulator